MNSPLRPTSIARPEAPLAFRWRILALVWLAYVCFGLTITTIAPLVGPILADLNMTNSQMGLVLGVWQLVFIVTASPLGALVDRMGERRAIAIGLSVVLASLLLRGLAVNFLTLLLAVALFGIGGPIISIGAPKVVSLWFRGEERGVAAGVYATAPITGMALALSTAASIVLPLTGTWRGVSVVYGGFVIVVLVLWLLLARNAPPEARLDSNASRQPPDQEGTAAALRALLSIGNVRIVLALGVAAFMVNHGLQNWLPTLLQEKGMSLEQAGAWVSAATMAGVAGQLLMPVLARRGHCVFALTGMFAFGAATTVGLALLTGAPLIVMMLASSIIRTPFMPVLTLVLMETPGVGARRMGSAAGLFFSASEVGGFSGPFLMGVVRDATGGLTEGLFVLAGVVAALMVLMPFLKEGKRAERA